MFLPSLNSGVVYWRLYNFAKAMDKHRIAYQHMLWWQRDLNELHPWQIDIAKPEFRARIINELWDAVQKADVVVMQAVQTKEALDLFLSIKDLFSDKFPEKKLLLELDDNYISAPTYNPAHSFYAPNEPLRKLVIRQLETADGVIVSTPYLKQVYSDFNGNIIVAPNSIDFELWGKAKRKRLPGIRIGWSGGASHEEDLRIIEPVVRSILAKHPEVTFNFVHGIPEFLRGIDRVECVGKFARIDKYPQHIASQGWDIALAPLVDNAFNRGKSNLRWLEAAALGIPCVASKVGHFADTIRDGIDGFLAEASRDFENYLEVLIRDSKLRRLMGQEAKDRVLRDFNVEITARKYAEDVRALVDKVQVIPPQTVEWIGIDATGEVAIPLSAVAAGGNA